MANHKSALKRHRQSLTRSARNRGFRTQLKTHTKKVYAAVEENNGEDAKKALHDAQKSIAKIASKGVIHKRAAARKISSLTRRVNAMSASA
ncbi:MAG: 30S ribosomal protein S20 [Candidatus Nitronauta litoralis]|uniref:Small ribosomal subunit protein bS20 n=1 Tax=Candidatus Nitronauta litoralis TaxID=2705533 RepID=A0A7T0FZ35_9BACT|nr:MAG: 30S ribosomal protein S20 [Candidatus Nitronauta litoralis]